VNGSFRALQVIPGALSGGDFIARQPKYLTSRGLKIVPDRFSIGAEELMSGYFLET
jgi:hypothetical protein